jgi:catechol 2,3-dioxygenase-like lactoylglutathione lyase family enzyme
MLSRMRAIMLITCALLATAGCKGARRSPLVEAARGAGEAELARAIPIFEVRELKASQRYYREALGFKVDWEHGDPPDFGSVSRAETVIFQCQGCGHPAGAWVMIFTPDVDRLHRELAARKARIVMPPRDMPWGLREMNVADPDGNVLRFASRPHE